MLLDGDDFLDLGNALLEESFDPHFEGLRSAGAAFAGALEADSHGIVVVNTH